jgi:hypothetical protein
MATKKDDMFAELWVGWTRDAMTRYSPPEDVDNDELVDDMVEVATKYADSMLDVYEETFFGGTAKKRRKRDEDDE